jgi:serine/threonine protein kinase
LIDTELYKKLYELLVEYLATEYQRIWMGQALIDCDVLQHINWEGTAQDFTHNLINVLLHYGACTSGEPAIVLVLKRFKELVGDEKRERAENLISQIRNVHQLKSAVEQIGSDPSLQQSSADNNTELKYFLQELNKIPQAAIQNSQNDPLRNKQLGDYEIVKILGGSKSSKAYLSHNSKLDHYYTIKVIHLPTVDSNANDTYERFMRETWAVARLNHRHILKIYQFDRVDNLYYIVKKYTNSLNLQQILKWYKQQDKILPVAATLQILHQIAAALDYAHQQNIIHRDVKPSNILISRDTGDAILDDFAVLWEILKSTSDDLYSSIRYVAPEQSKSAAQAFPQSDQYSVGILAYELLTGRIPFDGADTSEIAAKHANDLPPSMTEVDPLIHFKVEQVIMKALDKDVNRRYKSVREFVEMLSLAFDMEQSGSLVNKIENVETLEQPEMPFIDVISDETVPAFETTLPGIAVTHNVENLVTTETINMEAAIPENPPPAIWSIETASVIEKMQLGTFVYIKPNENRASQSGIDRNETGWVLGRGQNSDIVLDDPTISETHAFIRRGIDGQFLITDTRSTNGIWLNEQRLPVEIPTIFTESDILRIGRFWFRLNLYKKPQVEKSSSPEITIPEAETSEFEVPIALASTQPFYLGVALEDDLWVTGEEYALTLHLSSHGARGLVSCRCAIGFTGYYACSAESKPQVVWGCALYD